MLELSDRVRNLRDRALRWSETQQQYIGQRLVPALRGLSTCSQDAPLVMRKATMLATALRESAAIIHDDELIVGYNFSGGDDQIWLEMAMSMPGKPDFGQIERYLSSGVWSDDDIREALATIDNPEYAMQMHGHVPEPETFASVAPDEGLYWCGATAYNHTIIDYALLLERGFLSLAEDLRKRLTTLDIRSAADLQRRMVYESMVLVAEGGATIGDRYADHVRNLKRDCEDARRRGDLDDLEKVLRQVPAGPALTFYDAVQSLWFAHSINTWEDGINANSIGRLDQILFPYYQRDIEAGRLNEEDAFELLCCLWIKLYRDYDVQQIALGGCDSDGNDATNELTYLMLDVTEALGFIRCLSVRLHSGSPRRLYERSLQLVGHGTGIPFFFNDDVLIPALTGSGIAKVDARDYAAIGCVEITIPGKANPHAVSSRINLLKCLELALNEGCSMTTGSRLGPSTTPAAEMGSLDEVISAYETQVEHAVHSMCRETLRRCMDHRLNAPMPYKSLLTEGCRENGIDFNDCGAKYDYHESMPMGIPNVADSLAAIQTRVFDQGRYSMTELVTAIRKDFPDESTRLDLLRNAPKFGNDDDTVDSLAARVFRSYCDLMTRVSSVYGTRFFAQPFTFLWLVDAGLLTGATPDGRHRGENLAYSVSPTQGRDFEGLSALIHSLSKLPQHLAPGSTSAIIEIDPALFSDDNFDRLVAMMQTAVDIGVGQIQFNVVSEETLKKAQLEPEKFRNLAVRVSGFSQKFSLLSKDIQDHIIARTKHTAF